MAFVDPVFGESGFLELPVHVACENESATGHAVRLCAILRSPRVGWAYVKVSDCIRRSPKQDHDATTSQKAASCAQDVYRPADRTAANSTAMTHAATCEG